MEKLNYWANFIKIYKNWFELIKNRLFKVNSTKTLLRNGYQICSSDTSPLSVVMDETFILQRYNPGFLKIEKDDVVVDIGAHIGDFSIFANIQNASYVYAIEPDPDTYKLLIKNINLNNIKNIISLNKAVTDKVQNIKFYKANNDGGNSIYKRSKNQKPTIVESTTIDQIMKKYDLDKIDFLKIDCEGSEGLIFKTISNQTLKKINKISMEYHNNFSVLNSNEIKNILIKSGFEVKVFELDKNFGYIYAFQSLR